MPLHWNPDFSFFGSSFLEVSAELENSTKNEVYHLFSPSVRHALFLSEISTLVLYSYTCFNLVLWVFDIFILYIFNQIDF